MQEMITLNTWEIKYTNVLKEHEKNISKLKQPSSMDSDVKCPSLNSAYPKAKAWWNYAMRSDLGK